MTDIAENISLLRAEIGNTKLIAVSKMQKIEAIRSALVAGQRVFGENRVQEAAHKFSVLRHEFHDIELHLIGALQTNKVPEAVSLFDVIQTLDRPRLADALAAAICKSTRTPRLYIEVNIGDEPQKGGITPACTKDFLLYCRMTCGLTIEGLMCIPPVGHDPVLYFKRMKEMATEFGLSHLSMGMSADYKAAIACGATEVRIGTRVFGKRA